jgi:hypothetical protein
MIRDVGLILNNNKKTGVFIVYLYAFLAYIPWLLEYILSGVV